MANESKQALDVFYDYVTRDAAIENDKIQSENAALKAGRDKLLSLQIVDGDRMDVKIKVLTDEHSEDALCLSFPIDPVTVPTAKLFQIKLNL